MTESPALQFLTQCWNAIPRRSWRNRNTAMQNALSVAITAGMEFHPDDFRAIYDRFNASYWIGCQFDNYYGSACAAKSGSNISAAIAMEKSKKRPAFLWAERTKVAERLYIGEQFTWRGHRVTVTSIRSDSLIACTYTEEEEDSDQWSQRDQPKVGKAGYVLGDYRMIEAFRMTPDGTIMLRASAPVPRQTSKVEKRFTVTFEELSATRKAYDAKRRAYEKEIEAATELPDLEPIRARFAAEGVQSFRHFDVELIRTAFTAADKRIREAMDRREQEAYDKEQRALEEKAEAADLERWIKGEDVRRYFSAVRLRVKGDWVETSTQQKASVAGVRQALAFIKKHRRKGWNSNGAKFDLDQYPLEKITAKGVQVGCTFVEWAEVDRIGTQLSK